MSIFDLQTTVSKCLGGHYGQPLGEGLWGRTYDLGDGSVVKLARAEGGIGDGRDLIDREAKALTAFGGFRDSILTLPAYYGHGAIPGAQVQAKRQAQRSDERFSCWLRMGRLNGVVFSADRYDAMGPQARLLLSRTMALALARFHQLSADLRGEAPQGDALVVGSRRDWILGAIMAELPLAEQVLAKRLRLRYRQLLLAHPNPVWAHGDVNPSNVLVLDAGGIGLVDFAENGWDLPAVDFAHWRTLGWLNDDFLAAYRDHGGAHVSDQSIHVIGAINAFVGLVLDRRLGDTAAVANARAALNDCLMAARLID